MMIIGGDRDEERKQGQRQDIESDPVHGLGDLHMPMILLDTRACQMDIINGAMLCLETLGGGGHTRLLMVTYMNLIFW